MIFNKKKGHLTFTDMQSAKILINILMIFAALVFTLPSENIVQALEKEGCSLMDQNSGPCHLEINGAKYNINAKGIIVYNSPDENTKSIKVILPDNFYIEAVKFYNYNDEIIFILEITDDDAGSTLITMFDPKDSSIKWTFELGAFNPSPPLFSGGSVYMAGIGTVAKIDAKTGQVIWKHTELYESDTTAFNSFEKPLKQGDIIIFKEKKAASENYRRLREIRIDDGSGKILK